MATSRLARDYRRGARFSRSHACGPQRRRFGSLPPDEARQTPIPAAVAANIREVLAAASKVASMPDRDAAQRYHDLIDQQLLAPLTAAERFELERIEARLDARDGSPLREARDREWEADRIRLLDSIHSLLARFQK